MLQRRDMSEDLRVTKTRQNIVCLPHKVVVEIAVSDNTKGNEADVIAK